MSTKDKDTTKISTELAAAFVADDAAELIALSVACSWETTRAHWAAVRAAQEGLPIPTPDNPYVDVLHDLLAAREVLPTASAGAPYDADAAARIIRLEGARDAIATALATIKTSAEKLLGRYLDEEPMSLVLSILDRATFALALTQPEGE